MPMPQKIVLIGGAVSGCIQEFFEAGVCHWILIDVKAFDGDRVEMVASR